MTDKMNVMLDIETMGLKPGCVVLSLGAVAFDPVSGILDDYGEVHVRLDASHQHSVGLKVDPETALWWMGQSTEAQQALLDMPEIPVPTVLAHFNGWLEEVTRVNLDDVDYLPVQVWGNGANFDAPMLREVYDAFGMRCPWGFWDERCHRTERKSLKAVVRMLGDAPNVPALEGVQHSALDDAKYQATVLASLAMQRNNLIDSLRKG